jgi:cytochrome c-type biogenesis protein CcsB
MHALFLWGAAALYGAGIVLAYPGAMRGRPSLSKISLFVLGLGLISHATAILALAVEMGRFPVADLRSALSFFAFLTTLAFFLAYLRYRINLLGILMLPLAFVLTVLSAIEPGRALEPPSLASPWVVVHIACIMLGYAGFFLTFVAAVMYLIQEKELKSKKPRTVFYRLPSLEVCDHLYRRSLIFGFPFLTAGILTGFVWASLAWHGDWQLDPKILSALITWVIYLILFSARLSGNWSGRRSAYVAIFGFAIMMVTFLGISFFSGFHGYFPNLGKMP